MATTFFDVIESFESSFMDKKEIPESLEKMWLIKAIGNYGVEISPLIFDSVLEEFGFDLDQYTIDVLATTIKVYYLEREYSRVNKIASIVGKDLSINGNSNLSKYTEDELKKTKADLLEMFDNLKPTAYN
ncbi:hypothetical protein [Kineothrix sedimenti]|uniref:Uncharacterized protein n=1 Tax=Kineothrix sedimenti TaxID=3123317 RepID=A0ABZ3F1N4_9FIRM